jgi:N-formylglutamate amidohydrolase
MNVILHIPHASTLIPEEFHRDYTDLAHAQECADTLVDHGTKELYLSVSKSIDTHNVVFPYSRVFCDVERFDSDEEEMNVVGMGVVYTHSHIKREIRRPKDIETIKSYYHEHHNTLNRKCAEAIENDGEVLFVDIHSFADEALPYELHKDLERPDICIGYEEKHLTENRLRILIDTVESYGYTVAVNEPFIGCLIPGDYYQKDERVQGFMFEMNKRLLPEIEKVGELLTKMIDNIK